MDDLIPILPETALSLYQARAREFIRSAKAPATLQAYRSDWKSFTVWCEHHRLQSLPAQPETVALYLAALSEIAKVTTMERRLAAISQIHQAAGHESPTRALQVRLVLQGARRIKGVAPDAKAPAIVEEIRAMVEKIPVTLQGRRDRAILLVGFAGAFRRSELVALDTEDLEWSSQGVVITIRRSKTDQEGEGRRVAIPYGTDLCPVRVLREWMDAAGITSGPIFRNVDRHGRVLGRLTGQSVALVVKHYAEQVGLDPARYAGHSLRSGLCTSAAAAGVEERVIMAQTGHQTEKMVRRYIRAVDLFSANAAAEIGL